MPHGGLDEMERLRWNARLSRAHYSGDDHHDRSTPQL
jgi:hypothetical protein